MRAQLPLKKRECLYDRLVFHTVIVIDLKALEEFDSALSFSTSSSIEVFPWWVSPLQGKDFLQFCEYLHFFLI